MSDTWVFYTSIEWKNIMSQLAEAGAKLPSLESELYHDYRVMVELAEGEAKFNPEDKRRIAELEHERGMLREAIVGNTSELDALADRNRRLLKMPDRSCADNDDDRCDSDPPKK